MPIHVFVGPTLPAAVVSAIVPDALLHPPVSHGDLLRLPLASGDVVVIVDGLFHHTASVRHKEILALLAEDIAVVGCSSMGALRATELAPYGMVGHGWVFDMYRSGTINADDEVVVAHTEAPEYRKLSEPLITFRYAAVQAVRAGVIGRSAARTILAVAKSIPYTSRSWRAVEAAASHACGELALMVRWLQAFEDERPDCRDIKAFDARETLACLDRLVAPAPGSSGTWAASEEWRRRHLSNWQAEFAQTWVDGVQVRTSDILRYEQLYDPEFPARWRRFALGQIESSQRKEGPNQPADPAAGALEVAASWGLTPGSLTTEQTVEWLTEREEDLPAEERLLLVLIRSFRHSCMAYELTAGSTELIVNGGARAAVAESYVVNEQVVSLSPEQSMARIKRVRLRQHLADTWSVPAEDERALVAAVRDRGFASLADGVEAARPFLLRQLLRAHHPALAFTEA